MRFLRPTADRLNNSHTKLLLRGDSLTDASPNARALTNSGVTVAAAPGGHPYAKSAGYFNGAAYLTTPNNSDFNLASYDFTIQGWFDDLSSGTGGKALCCLRGNSYGYLIMLDQTANTISLWLSSTGASWDIASARPIGTYVKGVLNYFQLTRNGNNFETRINGAVTDNFTSSSPIVFPVSNPFCVGANYYSTIGNQFIGYMVDFMLSVGIARATDVPKSPLVADAYTKFHVPMMEYNGSNGVLATTFTDFSPSPKTITVTGARQTLLPAGTKRLAFSSTFISAVNSGEFDLGTDICGFDCLVRVNSIGSQQTLISCGTNATTGYYFVVNTSGQIVANFQSFSITTTACIYAGVTHHVYFIRQGSSLRIFVDGKLVGSATNAAVASTYSKFFLGVLENVGQYLNGGINNFRFFKGQVPWDKPFCPPLKPY